MIVITGARGFIGSNLIEKLNAEGYEDLILVDEIENKDKNINLSDCRYEKLIDRSHFLDWFVENYGLVKFVFHLGARTDTTEQNVKIFTELNLNYSKSLFSICSKHQIPIIYASSAATYGKGEFGYNDQYPIQQLKPLNPYGWSKQNFDLWVKEQNEQPPFWAGLKFFNVYGKHEGHKHRMSSVILHAYDQIQKTGKMKLFMSHKESVGNGEQKRDFIAVQDVVDICFYFFLHPKENGLYNVGTGKARTYNDLTNAVFLALKKPANIEYIPTPKDIRESYQYYTQAEVNKLRLAGYKKAFISLEGGVEMYVQEYLGVSS